MVAWLLDSCKIEIPGGRRATPPWWELAASAGRSTTCASAWTTGGSEGTLSGWYTDAYDDALAQYTAGESGRCTLPTVAAIGHRVSAAVLFVGQSLFDLLTLVWRTGARPAAPARHHRTGARS
ncbi:hypothetical protein JCM13580A_61920 [Streptomyces drozdowiczii]